MIQPMPIPASFTFGQAQLPDGHLAVVLVANRFSGTDVFFLSPADAVNLSKAMLKFGEAGDVLLPPDAPPSQLVGADGNPIAIPRQPNEIATTIERDYSDDDPSPVESDTRVVEAEPKLNRQQRRQAAREAVRELSHE